jgi:SAM-dependent methyltransferase
MTDRFRPDRKPGDLWDDLAEENARSAILYHATEEDFERTGKEDAEYLLSLMRARWPGRVTTTRTVLDIGGGIGRVAKHLSHHVGSYLLLDASGVMLKQAAEFLRDCPRICLFQGDHIDLAGIETQSVDFAFSLMVFQHLDRELVVRQLLDLTRVLKADGFAWIQVPAMKYPERFEEVRRGDWPANYRRWHPGEFLEVCLRCGLSVIAADLDRMEVVVEVAPSMTWMGRE